MTEAPYLVWPAEAAAGGRLCQRGRRGAPGGSIRHRPLLLRRSSGSARQQTGAAKGARALQGGGGGGRRGRQLRQRLRVAA
jgi:hypothetical protein